VSELYERNGQACEQALTSKDKGNAASEQRTYGERRLGKLNDSLEVLRELSILVDSDEEGQLMQVFTRSLHTRPTWFLEIIERRGARGFGGGNVKALFEAVEAEQASRTNSRTN
jgi:4-hydroxyphenylpyruvate dioxygenase